MISETEKRARAECIRIIERRGLSRRKARQSARFGAVPTRAHILKPWRPFTRPDIKEKMGLDR